MVDSTQMTDAERYAEACRRLFRLSKDDPETFEKLVWGDHDGVDAQLIEDLERIEDRL